ncbi:hypothetical protein B0J13DRAFT_69258 [Dactylonectria estremocensis]|uniref:Uncharacterized protein n=1 Tax=Dactylonectria estremocensis TaxID=1079267 RepID=A0A9P9EKQ2_9HYPO|nr:hypothetical protein B0J13DRAFT_69258 [Dactylonectria estremocensis]
MICYIYLGIYPRTDVKIILEEEEEASEYCSSAQCERDMELMGQSLTPHAKVYALAEKYQVSSLKEMALRSFKSVVDDGGCWFSSFADGHKIAYTTTIDED